MTRIISLMRAILFTRYCQNKLFLFSIKPQNYVSRLSKVFRSAKLCNDLKNVRCNDSRNCLNVCLSFLFAAFFREKLKR